MATFKFKDNKTGEDTEISIFPMNLGNVRILGEAVKDGQFNVLPTCEQGAGILQLSSKPTLLETAFDVKNPVGSLMAKLDIVAMCTEESKEELESAFDAIVLTECFTECMEVSGFAIATPGEKKTMNP